MRFVVSAGSEFQIVKVHDILFSYSAIQPQVCNKLSVLCSLEWHGRMHDCQKQSWPQHCKANNIRCSGDDMMTFGIGGSDS